MIPTAYVQEEHQHRRSDDLGRDTFNTERPSPSPLDRVRHRVAFDVRLDAVDRASVVGLEGAVGDVADMRRQDGVVDPAQGMIGGQRFLVEDIEGRPGDAPVLQYVDQGGLVDDGAARGVDEVRRRLHQRELGRADDADRALPQRQVDGDDVGAAEEIMLSDPLDAELRRPFRRQVLAPGDDVHGERLGDGGHLGADVPEADEAKGLVRKRAAKGVVPAPGAKGRVLLRDVAKQRQDQAPGQLAGGGAEFPGAGDDDASLQRRIDVDLAAVPATGDQKLEAGKPLQEGARERRALARRDDDVETREAFDQRVLVRQVIVENRDLDAFGQRVPVGHLPHHVEIIVQYRYPHVSSSVL